MSHLQAVLERGCPQAILERGHLQAVLERDRLQESLNMVALPWCFNPFLATKAAILNTAY